MWWWWWWWRENNRNAVVVVVEGKPSDGKTRLVVQTEFALIISMDDRRRFNYQGKVRISPL